MVDTTEVDDRPHTIYAAVALVVGTIAAALADHLTRAYHLGAERAGVLDPQPIELLGLDKRIQTQQAYLESRFSTDLLAKLEQAQTAEDVDAAFAALESRAELYAGQGWVFYQAAFKDFGVPDQLVDFVGPDDERDCPGCEEAVEGGPYPLASAPEPGSFRCGSNCRHELVPLENGDVIQTP